MYLKEKATRRRGAELEDAILDAAWFVLVDRGYPGFTYEAVAERAETSRPVLYRRWPERRDLLVATIKRFYASHPIPIPDTGTLRGDALALLKQAEAGRVRMLTLQGAQLVSGLTFREVQTALLETGPGPCEQIVARAVARGELPAIRRSPRVVNLPLDLYRHEVFMTGERVPPKVAREIVDDVWLPLLRRIQGRPTHA